MAVRGRTGIFPHRIDQTTDANASIGYEHKEVHAGNAYYATITTELDTGGILSPRMQTAASAKWAHMIWAIEAQSQITIEIYEGITDAFEVQNGYNRNRNYADTPSSGMEFKSAAGTLGTLIYTWISGSTTRARSAAVNRASGELVLKTNTKYEWRITSTGDNNTVSAYFTWYEHTNIEN
jgi:hypothetical protein